jgi:regulator of protease activity HflC (stomatin/prohibitin superfamily)
MGIEGVLRFARMCAQVFKAVRELCLTQLREEIGKLDIDQAFSSREHLGKTLLSDLNEVTQRWGVEITRVELQELQPTATIAAGACSVYTGARSH